MLQESPIRPQSNDARKETCRGQAFAASALVPETVTLEELERAGAMAVDEAEEKSEGEGARVPKTKKAPEGMTAKEWQIHRLTHLPYNPACRCCVAGRKRDDQHRRREVGPSSTS